jgi:hypothetical protein
MTYLLLIVLGLIILVCAGVFGFAFWILVNMGIERWQNRTRRNRNMATSISAHDLRQKRQREAAARRLKIRVSNSILNAERVTPKVPFEWEGNHK